MNRIWKICSKPKLGDEEVRKLKSILTKNEYPDHIVDSEISKFIKNPSSNQTSEPIPTVLKASRFIVLPFVSRRAESFANKLKILVSTNYPQVDFYVAFKTPNQIDRYFPFKDNVKSNNRRSMVVYKIKCGHINCDAS